MEKKFQALRIYDTVKCMSRNNDNNQNKQWNARNFGSARN